MKLEGDWSPSQYDSISLMWDGFYWIQTSSATGSTVVLFNPLIVAPAAAEVLLYNDTNGRWQNRAISGDITQTNKHGKKRHREISDNRTFNCSSIPFLSLG